MIEGELSPAIRNAAALYAGCVSGALQKDEYLAKVEAAGFRQLRVAKERIISLPDELLLAYMNQAELTAFRASGTRIMSLTVYGEA
ncbi:MAG: hypothetical protein D6722_26920 [Bacteroidetes bacterium]|nr:MAG: hypothetical protein D6722_26920 [Bacteroidota bacterium]